MQLRRGLVARVSIAAHVALALLFARPREARGDGGKLVERASTEMAAYSDTNHVAVLTPSITGHVENPTAGWSVDGSYLVDVVSAASVDIVSTASRRWTEVRQAGDARVSYKPGDLGGSVQGSVSNEPDYLSYAAGGTVSGDFDDRNVSLLAGYSYAHDTIGRTGTAFSVYSHTLQRHAFTASVTTLLDRRTVLAFIGDFVLERGDPSKPYRYIPLFSASIAPTVPAGATLDVVTRLRGPGSVLEQLPLSRDRFGITARLAHRTTWTTTRLEAHLYDDSWSVKAFSGDARELFDLGTRWTVGPHLRYYVQSAASFWQRAYVGTGNDVPALRTGDRELGPLMNLTAGGSARWALGPRGRLDAWVLGLQLDGTYTRFFDDLYITRNASLLGALTLEATW